MSISRVIARSSIYPTFIVRYFEQFIPGTDSDDCIWRKKTSLGNKPTEACSVLLRTINRARRFATLYLLHVRIRRGNVRSFRD